MNWLWLLLWMQPLSNQQVWIELPGASTDELAAAERGCQRGLGDGHCHVRAEPFEAEAPRGSTGTRYRVQVRWDRAGLHAILDFFEIPSGQAGDAPETETTRDATRRTLRFAQADPVLARYEAIGLVVAAYVIGHLSAERARSQRAARAQSSSLDEPAAGARERSRAPTIAGDLLFGHGTALSRGGGRFIVALRGALRPWSVPLYLTAGLEGAHRPSEPTANWWSAGLGLAASLPTGIPGLHLGPRATAVVERVVVSAAHPKTGAVEVGDVFRVGGRLGLQAELRLYGALWLLAGARLNALSPAVRVEWLGEDVGRQPIWGVDGLLGVRIGD